MKSINPRRDLLIAKYGEAGADAQLAEEGRQRAIDAAEMRRKSTHEFEKTMQGNPAATLAGAGNTVGVRVEWVEQVRAIALEYIAKHKASDLFPSQKDVCGHIETVAREKKIYGPQGKPISQSYIQRNAIQGEWWQKNKP